MASGDKLFMPWHLNFHFFYLNDVNIFDRFECDLPWAAGYKETIRTISYRDCRLHDKV